MQRYLTDYIKEDLKSKMVFVGGPRQVGKTTLSYSLLSPANEKSPSYYNWDSPSDRSKLLDERLPADGGLVVLDEIHKYRGWRNLVKGLYDKNKSTHQFLVTGSARLDYYRRGGDSLQGRYHYYRLHPFSMGELKNTEWHDTNRLMTFGGFPEPFFRGNEKFWRRWQSERLSRVLTEDLLSLERVNEVSTLKLLAEILGTKVGSPLSLNSLSEDLSVAHKTVKRWIEIFSNLYLCFLIPPYGSDKIRAVKKEKKLYLWDWSLCDTKGAQFENLVASQLLKYCHFIEDTEGFSMELRYLRDTDKREVDFVVLRNKKPEFAVECKLNDSEISPHIKYFKERTNIPQFYQVTLSSESYQKDGILVLPFKDFVHKLKLP